MNLILMLIMALVFLAPIVILDVSAAEEQKTLRVKSSPNILFMSGGGSYDIGTVVSIPMAPESWNEYTFVGWQIDKQWAQGNPIKITMNISHTVEAVYEKSYSGNVIIDTIPRVAEINVDGEIYLPSELPLSFDWDVNSQHILTIEDIIKDSPNTRYKFDSWKDNDITTQRTVTATTEKQDFIVLYKVQHLIKTISEIGIVEGGGWVNEGSAAKFGIESDIVLDKKNDQIRYVFNSWNSGDYLNSPYNSIDVEEATTVRALWDEQYYLQLKTNIPEYDVFGNGWYDTEKQVALIAEDELESTNSDTKYVFDKWVSKGPNPVIIPNAQSPSTTITMLEPYIIEAQYKKSYLVNVWTPFGNAIGAGFYKENDVAEISMASNQVVVQPNQERKIFSGWDTQGARIMGGDAGSGELGQNLLVFVDKPMDITANWKSQYYLDVQSTTKVKVKGSGWYDLGRMVPISVDNLSTPAGMWSAETFDRWTGDIDKETANSRVMMNGPKAVIAEFKIDNTPGIINSIILAAMAGVGAIVFKKTRKNIKFNRKPKRSQEFEGEQNPFQKYSEEQRFDDFEFHPRKQKKKAAIMDWLMGR